MGPRTLPALLVLLTLSTGLPAAAQDAAPPPAAGTVQPNPAGSATGAGETGSAVQPGATPGATVVPAPATGGQPQTAQNGVPAVQPEGAGAPNPSQASPAQTGNPAAATGAAVAPTLPGAAPTSPAAVAPAAEGPASEAGGAPDAVEAPAAQALDLPFGLEAANPFAGAPRDENLPHDLTPWGMFMAADWVVKAVMIGLAFASLVTWTIWLAKALEIGFAKRRARAGVARLERAETLSGAMAAGRGRWRGPIAALAGVADEERQRSGVLHADGVKERAAIAMTRIEARAGRSIGRGTGLLATIGATAPFVGLFGTVWGIMNSFISISESNTTNLAVVAPGIAEALLATGIGLVAAIPAVIIYNFFSRSIAGYRAILADGSAAVMRHLSRDLDRERGRGGGYQLAAGE